MQIGQRVKILFRGYISRLKGAKCEEGIITRILPEVDSETVKRVEMAEVKWDDGYESVVRTDKLGIIEKEE